MLANSSKICLEALNSRRDSSNITTIGSNALSAPPPKLVTPATPDCEDVGSA